MAKAVMSGPTWFRVAVEALVVLAHSDGHCPSAAIAEHVEAHAVFLRRVMAQLVRVQIVTAREGRNGGYRLAREAREITLGDVYRAVQPVGAECEERDYVSASVEDVLSEITAEAEQRALDVYDRYTLASILERIALPE